VLAASRTPGCLGLETEALLVAVRSLSKTQRVFVGSGRVRCLTCRR
jgi:hypothetical protein